MTLIQLLLLIASIPVLGLIIYYLVTKNRERIKLIEKGINPDEGFSKSDYRNETFLRNGILLISLGLGLFIAHILNIKYEQLNDTLIYISVILFFVGIGFLVIRLLKKKAKIILLLTTIGVLLITSFISLPFVKTNAEFHISSYSKAPFSVSDTTENIKPFNKPYKIVFHGLSGNNTNTKDPSEVIIDVYVENEETTLGVLRFLPVYKPIHITAYGNYRWNNPLKKLNKKNNYIESKNYEMEAQLTVFGFCSIKKSKEITQNFIDERIRKLILSEIEKGLNLAQKI